MNHPSESTAGSLFRLQFSMRTMLVLSVVTAVLSWLWWRPQAMEVVHPGGLTERYYFKVAQDTADQNANETTSIRHGRYVQFDSDGVVRARGFYADDVPAGTWSFYHRSGQRAQHGRVQAGTRVGPWVFRDSTGTKLCRTEFDEHSSDDTQGTRSGPSVAWWPNGQLRYQGSYQDNRRTGPWQFWDQKRKLVCEGQYEFGRRVGVWSFPQDKSFRVGHRVFPDLDGELERLADAVRSPDPIQATKACRQLVKCGPPAHSILISIMQSGSVSQQITVVRAIRKQTKLPPEMQMVVVELCDAKQTSLAVAAAITAMQFCEQSDQKTRLEKFLTAASQLPASQRLVALERMAAVPTLEIRQVDRAMNHGDEAVRAVAYDLLQLRVQIQ